MSRSCRRNELGYYTRGKYWNYSAVMCYLRGCNCTGCEYEEFFTTCENFRTCQMKASVLEMVRVYGKPKVCYENLKKL